MPVAGQSRPGALAKVVPVVPVRAAEAFVLVVRAKGSPPIWRPRSGRIPWTPWEQPPRNPLATVLDADGDGVISADELKNASKALSQLDRNRDGKITRDEMYPRQSGNQGDAMTSAAQEDRARGDAMTSAAQEDQAKGDAMASAAQEDRAKGDAMASAAQEDRAEGDAMASAAKEKNQAKEDRMALPTRAVQGQEARDVAKRNNLQTDETLAPSINPRMGTSYHRLCGPKTGRSGVGQTAMESPETNQFPQTGVNPKTSSGS